MFRRWKMEDGEICAKRVWMTKPIAPIATNTPQLAMENAVARGVAVESGIKLLKNYCLMNLKFLIPTFVFTDNK